MAGRFSIEAVFKAFDAFSAPVGKMQRNLERMMGSASRSVGQVNRVTDKVAGGFMALGAATVAAAIPAGLALYHVGKAGADFEQAITNVGAVMGKNRGQIQDLEKEAMRLGVATQFSSTEVADAMEFMARKGFDSKEILAGIPGVLNAVAASGQGTAEVATVVGSAIRGFGLDASKTSKVADLLTFASERTGATITDLGEALSTAAPTAKTLGVSIEDTTAAVGLMQKMGIDASTAGTAVATMLAKISKPSKEAAQQMAAYGIKFKDAKGNMLSFRDVLGQFVKAGDKAGGNMDRMAFFAELVGLRGDKAALALSDLAKSGDFDKLVEGLEHVDGYAQKVADTRLDTTKGSWKLLTSTIEVLETKLFNLESGPLKGIIDKVNAWVQANQDLIVQKVEDIIQKISDNAGKFADVAERIGRAAVPILAVAGAFKAVGFAIGAIEAIAAANPLTLWIVGLTAAAALIAYFWPEIKAFFVKIWGAAKDMASRVAGAIGGFFSGIWSSIKGFFVGVAEFVVGLLVLAFQPLMPFIQPILDALGAAAGWVMQHWQPIADFFSGLWEGVKSGFSAFGTFIVDAAAKLYAKFLDVWRPVSEFFSGIWQSVADTFNSIVGAILDRVEKVIKFVQSVGAKALGLAPPGEAPAEGAGAEPAGGTGGPIPTEAAVTRREITESRDTTRHDVVIRDETGRATVEGPPPRKGFGLTLAPSGAF